MVGVGTFVAVIVAAWFAGLLPHDDGRLPDDRRPHGRCTIWFLGSSSIHRWTNLRQDLSPWDVRNRGIDGAMLDDIAARFSRVSRDEGRPAAIAIYAGENDIAAGRDTRSILRDLVRIAAARDRMMKDVPLLVLSMKPSPGRAEYLPQQQRYNAALRAMLPHLGKASYVDITGPLLSGGMPRSHYRDDGIHLTLSGYAILAKTVREGLDAHVPPSTQQHCGVPSAR